MIEIRGLTLRYGQSTAVDRLDLDVRQGEALVLLGPSGCGKTRALRCIAGLEQPDAGVIVVDGVTVCDEARGVQVPAHKRNIGMVFQSYAIWPHKTVHENVAFSLKMKRLPRDEIDRRVADALALVGMAQFASRGASLLSGGQMQRIALARSVVMEPAVLMLDEPLSNLDARLRERLRIELRQIQQRLGMTWVYVTHDQDEAFALADRVAVMDAGRIVQIGPPQEIYGRPRSASIAEFLGVENVLPCEVVSDDGAAARVRAEGIDQPVDGMLVAGAQARLHACFRAEDVELVRPGGAGPDAGRGWAGRVSQVTFLGGLVRYQVQLASGAGITMTRSRGGATLAIGDPVAVSVRASDVSLVPAQVAS